MSRAQFVVKGNPAPKGSRTFLGAGGASRESSEDCKPWVEAIAMSAMTKRLPGGEFLPPPYKIGLRFVMPKPANPKWPWPSIGDIDKLERAVLDGLKQGGLILDDRHVTRLDSEKEYPPPGGSTGVSIVIL